MGGLKGCIQISLLAVQLIPAIFRALANDIIDALVGVSHVWKDGRKEPDWKERLSKRT